MTASYLRTECTTFSSGCKHNASTWAAYISVTTKDSTLVKTCFKSRAVRRLIGQNQHHLQPSQTKVVFDLPCTLSLGPRPRNIQELLTELPNDTCAIPEPLEIPAIPEVEDRNDNAATPPASATVEKSELNSLQQTANFDGADQADCHPGRDR